MCHPSFFVGVMGRFENWARPPNKQVIQGHLSNSLLLTNHVSVLFSQVPPPNALGFASAVPAIIMRLSKAWLCLAFLPLANSAAIINDPFNLRHIPYTPVCAYACRLAIQSHPLECTPKGSTTTPPDCFASNEQYLTSLAYCMSTRCTTVSLAKLNTFWTKFAIGTGSYEPVPQISYKVALQKAGTPNVTAVEGQLLNKTSIISEESYQLQFSGLLSWNQAEYSHSVSG